MTMHYLDIKRHIINKKYLWGYIIIIFISLIFSYLIYTNKLSISLNNFSLFHIFFLTLLFLSILSIRCILINAYRCQNFYKFYVNNLREHNTHFHKIVIEKEDYKMPVPTRSFSTTVRPSPKSTNAIYLETDDYFLLFFSISYFGVIQEVLNPFIFVKTLKEFYTKGTKVNVIRTFETIETEENRTIIFPNNYEITKVIIPLQLPPSKKSG